MCAYKTGNIPETVEDRARVSINGLYKVVHGLSIATKMYDHEWPLSEIQGHCFLKCHKMTKYSLVMTSKPCIVAGCIISVRPTYSAPVHLVTYLHSWLWAYKPGNISETVEDRAKDTINGLYKIVHGLSIAAKMCDLEWPVSEIQGHWFFKCRKMTKHSWVMTPTPFVLPFTAFGRPWNNKRTVLYWILYCTG